jgi:hypothetical protein
MAGVVSGQWSVVSCWLLVVGVGDAVEVDHPRAELILELVVLEVQSAVLAQHFDVRGSLEFRERERRGRACVADGDREQVQGALMALDEHFDGLS